MAGFTLSTIRAAIGAQLAANIDQAAVRHLDQYLSVGTGNSWSVVDALKVDDTFGGAVSGLEVAPGDYDAENVTADLLLTFIAMKQNAEV